MGLQQNKLLSGKVMTMAKELTAGEACQRLNVTLDALYRLLYAAKLPARKTDGRWLIPAEAVEARLKAREARQKGSRR